MSNMRLSTAIGQTGREDHAPDRSVRRICQQSGIDAALAEQRLLTLRELRDGLDLAMREARAAEKDQRFWGRALTAAKFTKATCNVILSVFGSITPGPAGKTIQLIDKGSQYAQKGIEGDVVGLSTLVGNDAAGLLITDPRAKPSVEAVLKRAELVKDGLKGDLNGREIAKYIVNEQLDLLILVAEEAGHQQFKKVVEVTKAVHGYSHELYDIVESHRENDVAEGSSAGVKTLISQMQRLDAKIAELERVIHLCVTEAPTIRLN